MWRQCWRLSRRRLPRWGPSWKSTGSSRHWRSTSSSSPTAVVRALNSTGRSRDSVHLTGSGPAAAGPSPNGPPGARDAGCRSALETVTIWLHRGRLPDRRVNRALPHLSSVAYRGAKKVPKSCGPRPAVSALLAHEYREVGVSPHTSDVDGFGRAGAGRPCGHDGCPPQPLPHQPSTRLPSNPGSGRGALDGAA